MDSQRTTEDHHTAISDTLTVQKVSTEKQPSGNNAINDKHESQSCLSSILSWLPCCGKGGNDSNEDLAKKKELDLAKEISITEHLLSVSDLESKFCTNSQTGLSQAEAEARLRRDGPNAFSPPKVTPWWWLLLRELTTGFAFIMWLAVIASLILYTVSHRSQDYYLAVVLALVVIVTGVYSFSQQQSSGKIFESFKNMIPPETTVIRDGQQLKVPADRLVVGDIVLCAGGERIPADVRILKCESMKVDNSSLTGESEALARSVDPHHESPLEAKNLAFFSTACVDGNGIGMVIGTGDRTVMGKIAQLVTHVEHRQSPITIEINRFVNIITTLAFSNGIIFFTICMILQMPASLSFVEMIGIVVGNIPEGLLPAVTVALTLTAKRMATKNCMIKYLEAVETLGSTSTICSDKTGTLTQNRMTVEHCYIGGRIIRVESHERHEVFEDMKHVASCWEFYQRCAKLCSRAAFIDNNTDVMKRQCTGDASEIAILRFMESVSPSVEEYRRRFPKVAEKPFSSVYKYQYSVHRYLDKSIGGGNCEYFVVLKGAPERIIKLCSTILNELGETIPMTDKHFREFEIAYRELGSMGERVLAFADLELPGIEPDHKFDLDQENDFEMTNFRFLGLVAMIDPPRPSVPGAISKCKHAGISVIMVTGDHPITAQAIAKSIGILTQCHRRSTQIWDPKVDKKYKRKVAVSIVVPGDELAAISDEDLGSMLRDFNEFVFARTSPQQKLRIVEKCQEIGHIVAVTGDGVNDSPALKKADIGIAMGITGSDVSKQAADMILMDDNFSSIVVGIEEGRKIFDNLKKTISYIMAGNSSTLYPFVVFLAFGFPVAVTPIKILCIAIGTDMVPAISLAYESAESDIMRLPPRKPKKEHLVTLKLLLWSFFQAGIIISLSGYLGYFVTLMQYGWMPWQLWQIRARWSCTDELADFYGQEWSLEQRNIVMSMGQTAYFVSVVVAQWMDVIVNKTRRVSVFTHGFDNWFLNFSILFETAIACFVVYTPGLNEALTFLPVTGWAWCTGLPFFCYLLAYEEIRKYIVRRWPESFLGTELCR